MEENFNNVSDQGWKSVFGWRILALTIIVILCVLIGNLVMAGILSGNGIDVMTFTEKIDFTGTELKVIKWSSMVNHLLIFTLSGIIFYWIFYRLKLAHHLLQGKFDFLLILYFIGWLMFSFPLIAYSAQINASIDLPQWAEAMDNDAIDFLLQILHMENISDLLLNLLIIALVPAIGEELLFRGVLQKELTDYMSNKHLAIIISSLIFSIFHFQLASLLPKFIIGLILGYSFYWTKNIVFPIIIHLFNNGLQVIILYITPEELIDTETNVPPIPLLSLIISAILCAVMVDIIIKRISHAN